MNQACHRREAILTLNRALNLNQTRESKSKITSKSTMRLEAHGLMRVRKAKRCFP